MKLTFKEKVERWYRRYILLRLKNPVFLGALLTILFAEICQMNKISPTSLMSWPDINTVVLSIVSNPIQFITLLGTTLTAFMNPTKLGAGDGKDITDKRLSELESKMCNKTEEPFSVPPIPVRQPSLPVSKPVVEVVINNKK